jgi:hypothetical protein
MAVMVAASSKACSGQGIKAKSRSAPGTEIKPGKAQRRPQAAAEALRRQAARASMDQTPEPRLSGSAVKPVGMRSWAMSSFMVCLGRTMPHSSP